MMTWGYMMTSQDVYWLRLFNWELLNIWCSWMHPGEWSPVPWDFKLTHRGHDWCIAEHDELWRLVPYWKYISERIFLVQPDIQVVCCPLTKGFSEEGEAWESTRTNERDRQSLRAQMVAGAVGYTVSATPWPFGSLEGIPFPLAVY